MSISQEQLQKIAEKLSKIPGDNSKLLGNITDILEYMKLLEEVDTKGIIPCVSVGETQALLREDILTPSPASAKTLLDCSPQSIIANQIVLPNIMK